MFFAIVRLHRSNGAYCMVGLSIEAPSLQAAVAQLYTWGAGVRLGSGLEIDASIDEVTTSKRRGVTYVPITDGSTLSPGFTRLRKAPHDLP